MPLVVPPPALCTDNGAMIGAAAARRFAVGERAGLDLDARPSLPLATRGGVRPPGVLPDASTRRPSGVRSGPQTSGRATGSRRTSWPTPTCSTGSSRRPRRRPTDRVLEIGPGLGILTRGLLDAGAAVTAVELDRGLAAWLRTSFADEIGEASLHLVEGDVLDQDLADLVAPPFLRRRQSAVPHHESDPAPAAGP